MPRRKNPIHFYRHFKPKNTARCRVNGQWVTLGKYNSPESGQAFARLCAELAIGPNSSVVNLSSSPSSAALTVDQVLLAFWKWAGGYYCTPDRQETSEIESLRKAIKPLQELYGLLLAAEFGPKKLKAVRQKMIEQGWCRGVINRTSDRITRQP
jgi:hypothetical protein